MGGTHLAADTEPLISAALAALGDGRLTKLGVQMTNLFGALG